MSRRGVAAVVAAASVIVGAAGLLSARAEPVLEGRPTHLSLGAVSAAAARTRLPRDKVKVAWRTHVSSGVRGPALVRAGEPTVVADAKSGALTFLGPTGEVERTVPVSSQGLAGSPLRIADGTIVAVTGTGDLVGYHRDQLRFRVAVGPVHTSPLLLALDDGGFVLGLDTELMAFDAHGALRGRASLSDRLSGELVAFDADVAAVTSAGIVVLWSPGGEVRSVGELGGSSPWIVGGQRTVTAIVDDARIVDLDVVTREVRTREEARGAALFLGAPLAMHSAARSFAVAELDGSRLSALVYPSSPPAPGAAGAAATSEPRRVRLATLPGLSTADAGAAPPPGRAALPRGWNSPRGAPPPLVFAPFVELLTDATGAFAFAVTGGGLGPGGVVGIADPATGTVITLERTLCLPDAGAAPAPAPGQPAAPGRTAEAPRTDIAGLAIGTDTLVVTCNSGDVVALVPLVPVAAPR